MVRLVSGRAAVGPLDRAAAGCVAAAVAAVMALAVVLACCGPSARACADAGDGADAAAEAAGADASEASEAVEACIRALFDGLGASGPGEMVSLDALDPADGTGAWLAFDLERAGSLDAGAHGSYGERVADYVTRAYAEDEGALDPFSPTTWSRTAIVALAFGMDPASIGTKPDGAPADLLADGIYDWSFTDDVADQGSNALIYGLIALDAASADVPEGARYAQGALLESLLGFQAEDGSFNLSRGGGSGSADVTGMALAALAPYAGDADVDRAIDAAVGYLSEQLGDGGRFEAEGDYSCETCAMVVVGLSAVKVDAASDARFVKDGASALDGLLSFRADDGSFRHAPGAAGDRFELLPTEQALRALLAYELFAQGDGGATSLYAATGWHAPATGGPVDGEAAFDPAAAARSFAIGAGAGLVVIGLVWAVRLGRARARQHAEQPQGR